MTSAASRTARIERGSKRVRRPGLTARHRPRWDLSHLHEFELPDGRLVGYPDDTCEPDIVWHDHAKLKITRELKPGMELTYVFDLGDNWRHRCLVQPTKVDPLDVDGITPPTPVAIWGWGWIPDQYGRRSRNGDSDRDEP